MKARVPTESPFAVKHARLVSVHVPSLHKSSIASLARHQANATEFATKVCFSLLNGSEVNDVGYEGGVVQRVALHKLATCSAYRYT